MNMLTTIQKINVLPWDHQPGERTLWYRRFAIYRALGPNRTLEDAWGVCSMLGRRVPQPDESPPEVWHAMAKTWNWEERAQGYDLFILAKILTNWDHLMPFMISEQISVNCSSFFTEGSHPPPSFWSMLSNTHPLKLLHKLIPDQGN